MIFEVRLFATLKVLAQKDSLQVSLGDGGVTVKQLLKAVSQQFPSLQPCLETVLVAVNNEYAFPNQPLEAGDDIALFPPVSGG